jgi:NitT/TauT family transport system substrate-binding protein
MAPVWVAAAKGFWKEEGLNVTLTTFDSGTSNQQALAGNVIDVGAGAFAEPINLSAQDQPTAIFGAIKTGLPYLLMATPTIKKLSDLQGKTIGVSKVGSLTDISTRVVLKKNGVDPSSVHYQATGQSNTRVAALIAGAVDATMLDSASVLHAQDAGMHSIADYLDELPGFPFEALYAREDYLKGNHDTLVQFMEGYIKAAEFTTDPANKDEVLSIVGEATGLTADDLEVNYTATIDDFPSDGAPDLEAITTALDGFTQYAGIDGIEKVSADALFDPAIQKEAAAALRN